MPVSNDNDTESEEIEITFRIIGIAILVIAGESARIVAHSIWVNRSSVFRFLRNSFGAALFIVAAWMTVWLFALQAGGAQ
jgi:hypothetical protein